MSMRYLRNRSGRVLVFIATHTLLACVADDSGGPSDRASVAEQDDDEDNEEDRDRDNEEDRDQDNEEDRDQDGSEVAPIDRKMDAGTQGSDPRLRDTGPGALETLDASGSDAGAGGDAGTDSDDAGMLEGGAEPVMTCLPTANLTPGEVSRTLEVDGVSRTYLLHVPPGYTGEEPVPLVLDWHGLLLDGATQRATSGYAELSDKEGFLVAFPNGIDNAWNVGPCCTLSRDVDDVAFARALVAEIARLGCIEPKRVYSTGFSNGGGMTMNLACNAADLFAAVAPAAFDLLAEDEQPCHPSRPIPIITFRGTSDFIVPYEGGASNPPNGLPTTIHFRGAQATFEFWQEANGCSGSPTKSGSCVTYSDCDDGVQTTLCTMEGLLTGNHLPGDAELGWATMKQYTLP